MAWISPRIGLLQRRRSEADERQRADERRRSRCFPQQPLNFVGNVESRDLLSSICDVVVCDGFAGNIMLKSMEGARKGDFQPDQTRINRIDARQACRIHLKPKLKVLRNVTIGAWRRTVAWH